MSKNPKPNKKTKSNAPGTPSPTSVISESGDIKQGTIAKFMRKRTQLVGFETGLNKHTQYAIEFLDNAIDALEHGRIKTAIKMIFAYVDEVEALRGILIEV